MQQLICELHNIYSHRKIEIKKRLREFKRIQNDDIFYEMCFCLLTPQSSGFRADACVHELKKRDFLHKNFNPKLVLKKKIRFHNNKTRYLLELKKNYTLILRKFQEERDIEKLRLWLLHHVKGYGLKEVAHCLRNLGYEDLAILDRHILKNLKTYSVIKDIPKTLTEKRYKQIEQQFKAFSKKVQISMDELDLLFWAQETGKVFK